MYNLTYTIYLTNGIKLLSTGCKFAQIPNFPISHIELNLPSGKTIVFEGFEKYLIIQTDYHIVQGGKGKVFDTLNILGKQGDNVLQVSYHKKGKVFQCKNKWGCEWKPLILTPLPKIGKKKQYKIEYNKPQPTNKDLWHSGLWMPEAKSYLKENVL